MDAKNLRLAVLRHEHLAMCLDCETEFDSETWAETKEKYQAHIRETGHRVLVHRRDVVGAIEPLDAILLTIWMMFGQGWKN